VTLKGVPVSFPVNKISDGTIDHYVYETIAHYQANNGVQLWTYGHDQLLELQSTALTNNTYYLRMVGFVRPGASGNLTLAADTGDPANPGVLQVCNAEDEVLDNWWVLTLDNQALGDTDPSGQTCGLHICTNQPTSDILQVAIVTAGSPSTTTVINGCDNVCINPTDLLQIDFVAYDPDGFLYSYDLELLYGFDQSVDLLCNAPFPTCNPAFSTWSLAPSPASIAPSWAPPTTQVGPTYADALTELPTSPVWSGGSIRLTVNAAAAFPQTCAYLLQLNVYKRTIVSCDPYNYDQYNVSFESFTIQVFCPQAGS